MANFAANFPMQSNRVMNSDERRTYRLGCRSFERGDVDTALVQFEHLLRSREGLADVHYRIGVIHDNKNDLAAAARSLWKALRINPAYSEAILALASVYERQGDFERAQEINARAQSTRAGNGRLDATTRGKLANLQAGLGHALREAGELREAIEAYRAALDRCPEFHDIRLKLAVTLREAGLPDQSLSELRRILRGYPNLHGATVQLGVTLYSLGRTDEAIQNWRAVAQQDSSREDAPMYLRMVRGS